MPAIHPLASVRRRRVAGVRPDPASGARWNGGSRAGPAGPVEYAVWAPREHRTDTLSAYQNGSIEGPHGHLKRDIADALALRGSR